MKNDYNISFFKPGEKNMSYEGRQIYLCPKGHLNQFDVYNDCTIIDDECIDEKKKPEKCVCDICGEELTYYGPVDDTNIAPFYKKLIMKGSNKKEYNKEQDKLVITIVPDIYKIVRGGKDEWFNFDTGEKVE